MAEGRGLAKFAPWLALVSGLVFAGLAWLGGPMALLGAVLAQPALALAVSWWRGTRPLLAGNAWLQGANALLLVWAAAFLLAGVLLAWPLLALRQSGSLLAALGLSAVAGALLIGLWRTWPLWHGLEREGGSLAAHWRALSERDFHAWHGLGVAALVAIVIGVGGALAWPGLLPEAWRPGLVVAYVLALPLLHWALQRMPAAQAVSPAARPGRPRGIPRQECLWGSLFVSSNLGD